MAKRLRIESFPSGPVKIKARTRSSRTSARERDDLRCMLDMALQRNKRAGALSRQPQGAAFRLECGAPSDLFATNYSSRITIVKKYAAVAITAVAITTGTRASMPLPYAVIVDVATIIHNVAP